MSLSAKATRILVIRGGAIGDFVLTLPILEALRTEASETEILGYPAIADLAVGRRHAKSSRDVDGAEWAPLFSAAGELRDAERAYLAGFDLVFCVWPDRDGVMRENLMRAGVRKLISVDPLPPEGRNAHVMDYVAEQCALAGVVMTYREPHLYPSERDRWWAERYMRVSRVGEAPLLGLHPGSGSAKKNWPARNYAALAQYWIRRSGNVLVFAGPADAAPLREFQGLLQSESLFCFQEEPLPHVAAVLERCEAFVGNDSGITHMAAAVRTPVVALFGPTNASVWRPLAPRVAVASAGEDMGQLKVEDVIRALEGLLARA